MVELHVGSLPKNTVELSICGGKEIKFQAQSFSTLSDFRRLRTDGTAQIIIKKHAFLNLTSYSFLVQITACSSIILETAAFRNTKVRYPTIQSEFT